MLTSVDKIKPGSIIAIYVRPESNFYFEKDEIDGTVGTFLGYSGLPALPFVQIEVYRSEYLIDTKHFGGLFEVEVLFSAP